MSSDSKSTEGQKAPAARAPSLQPVIEMGPPQKAFANIQEQLGATERVDPVERHTDTELASGTMLRNRNPKRVYRLVYTNGHQVSYYRNAGYRVEKFEQDGVRLLMDDGPLEEGGPHSEGQPIEFQGHVLMSIDQEKHEQLYQNGNSFFGGGQRRYDELERIVKSPTFDPVNLPGMRVENKIKDVVKR
jgi:hypothetical protein